MKKQLVFELTKHIYTSEIKSTKFLLCFLAGFQRVYRTLQSSKNLLYFLIVSIISSVFTRL
jgi:hypothetical protein